MTPPKHLLAALAVMSPFSARAADAPSWPCYHGPNGNFSATDCGLTLVDDLKDARLVWKSAEPTPPGAAQSPRYGGNGGHGISLKDFKPVTIPLAGGGEATSGGGVPLPGGGASSPLVAGGRVFVSYFVPSGDVVDANEQLKRDEGPGFRWQTSSTSAGAAPL